MKRLLVMAGLLILLPTMALADGPETGIVSGKVTDESGAPLPGVTVTLRGPAGETVQVSDSAGNYRFALVRPDEYTVAAGLEGFLGQESKIGVSAGGRNDVNFRLKLGTSDEITVTSETPLVDKYNVTVGGSIQTETVQEIAPVNRGIYGAIAALPGVTNDEESLDLSSSRPSFNGTPWQESAVFIDGVDATFTRYGATRMFIPNAATTEINMQASGSGADYGRAVGGITNVIVRSGTNSYKGEVAGIYQRLDWDANYDAHPEFEEHPTRPRAADFFVLTDDERDVDNLDYEVSFGGPLKRDKAWFFLASSEQGTFTRDRTLNGDLIDQSSDSQSYIAKLNFQPATDHSLAVSWMSTPITRLFQLDNFADPYVPTFHDIGGSLASANWNWSVNQSLFLETKLAFQESYEDKLLNPCRCTDPLANFAIKQADPNFLPRAGVTSPHAPVNNFAIYIDSGEGTWHNGWLLDNGFGTNNYPRNQVNLGLTQFVGQHELRYGLDWQETEWEQDVERVPLYTGTDFDAYAPFGYTTAGTLNVVRVDYNPPGLVRSDATATGENTALYLRDRFSAGDHWTFNLGLRYEDQVHTNDIDREVIDAASLSPRLNAVFDVKGNGRMLLTASAGRYYTHVNQELINSNLLDGWNGTNAQDNYLLCRPILFAISFPTPFGNCRTTGLNNFVKLSEVRPASMWALVDQGILDVDIEPYYRDEVVIGWEWQFTDTWAAKVRAIAWETANQITAGQPQLGPNGTVIQFTENVKDLPQILRDYGWVQAFVNAGYGTLAQAEAALDSFDDAQREYQGLQFELNRRFRGGWTWFNSVVLAQSEGNTFGTSFNNTVNEYGAELHVLVSEADIANCVLLNTTTRPSDQQADCDSLRPFLGTPVTTANRFGDAERERPIVFKSFGSKTWNFGGHSLSLGGLYSYQAGVGWHIQQTSVAPVLAPGVNGDTASLFVEPYGTRDIGGYAYLNLSTAWAFPLPGDANGELRLEVNNVTNDQELVGVQNTTGRPQQSKRAWSQPRKVRLSTTFRF